MSTRTANWVSRTNPGAAPPPPSRAGTAAPPPTIYPESSVSNPYASRYTGRSSRSSSNASSHHSSHSRSRSAGPAPSHYSSSHHSSSQHSSRTARQHHPMNTYYAQSQEPIIARTSDADGKTSSYMIIPAHGQKVEILHPTRAQTLPASSSSVYSSSSHKDKPLIKRLFDKVEWSGSASGASRSSASRTVTPSRVSRRNSTGGNTVVTSSGTRITSGSGRVYTVHYA